MFLFGVECGLCWALELESLLRFPACYRKVTNSKACVENFRKEDNTFLMGMYFKRALLILSPGDFLLLSPLIIRFTFCGRVKIMFDCGLV